MRSLSPGHRLTPSTGKACDRWGGEHVNARMYRLISSESPRKCTRFRKTRLSSNAQIFAPPLPLVPPVASLSPSSPGPARIAIPARAREFMRDLRENSRPYARDLIPLILPILPSPSPSPALPIHRAPALNRPNQFRESQSVRKDPIDPYSHSRYDRTTERKKERERERERNQVRAEWKFCLAPSQTCFSVPRGRTANYRGWTRARDRGRKRESERGGGRRGRKDATLISHRELRFHPRNSLGLFFRPADSRASVARKGLLPDRRKFVRGDFPPSPLPSSSARAGRLELRVSRVRWRGAGEAIPATRS